MILAIGIPDYPYRHVGDIKGGRLKGRKPGRDVPLILVTHEDMERMWAQHAVTRKGKSGQPDQTIFGLRGCPAYISFDKKAQRLWTFPASDGEYELLLEAKPEEKPGTLHLPKK